MAKVTVKDILSKISNIFKNDIYIYKKRYIVGGSISEDRNISRFFCVLNPECIEVMEDIPGDKDLVYLLDVRKSKESFKDDIVTDIEDSVKEEIITFIKNTEEKIDKVKTWDNFELTEEEKATLYDESISLLLFENDDRYPSVLVSKTLFPLVTIKTWDNLYYHVNLPKDKKDLIELITGFDSDYFQIYNMITYLDLDVEEE